MTNIKKNKTAALRAGRPPLTSRTDNIAKSTGGISGKQNTSRKSSRTTRTLINTFHQLHKSRAAAIASASHDLVTDIDRQIEQLGGLEAYQTASLTGQDKERGGDSSKKLVEWLRKHNFVGVFKNNRSLRILEVGALSSHNAISGMIGKGVSEVKRIDLNSQEPSSIEEIDFMDFPIPQTEAEMFDIISLSLVLNYVHDPISRGDMLVRTTQFLRDLPNMELPGIQTVGDDTASSLPSLFLVLPLPCLSNSRYMTRQHLVRMMESLGYEKIEHHESTKLCYMLFKWHSQSRKKKLVSFSKTQINPGKTRNNFAIVLKPHKDVIDDSTTNFSIENRS